MRLGSYSHRVVPISEEKNRSPGPAPGGDGCLLTRKNRLERLQVKGETFGKTGVHSCRSVQVSSVPSCQGGGDPHPLLGWQVVQQPPESVPGHRHQTPGVPPLLWLLGSLQCSCKTVRAAAATLGSLKGISWSSWAWNTCPSIPVAAVPCSTYWHLHQMCLLTSPTSEAMSLVQCTTHPGPWPRLSPANARPSLHFCPVSTYQS